MGNLIHGELSESIIGAGMAVLNGLRPGLDEKLYENALVIELTERSHSVEQQRTFDVHYKGQHIGQLIPDLIVDELVIVDTKVVSTFNDNHVAQMMGVSCHRGPAFGPAGELQVCQTAMETGGEMSLVTTDTTDGTDKSPTSEER